MTVFRTIRNSHYTTMADYHLKDKELSLKAKGLLSLMLSLPDDWHYSVNGLSAICKENKNTINNILKELEETGYLERNRIQDKGKIVSWEYVIYETNDETMKQNLKNDNLNNPYLKNRDIESCDAYKYTKQLSTNELSKERYKEKNIKKESVKSLISDYTQNEELKDCLFSFVEMRKNVKKPLTARAMKLSLNGLDKLALDDETKIAIVDNSILHNWLTFYPLEKKKNERSREEMGYAF